MRWLAKKAPNLQPPIGLADLAALISPDVAAVCHPSPPAIEGMSVLARADIADAKAPAKASGKDLAVQAN
jgi:hypothetical protein